MLPQLGSGAQVCLHLQIYNIFNLVQYTNLNTDLTFQDDPAVPRVNNLLLTSTTHARYTSTNDNIGTTPRRQIGITLRLDFNELRERLGPWAHAHLRGRLGHSS